MKLENNHHWICYSQEHFLKYSGMKIIRTWRFIHLQSHHFPQNHFSTNSNFLQLLSKTCSSLNFWHVIHVFLSEDRNNAQFKSSAITLFSVMGSPISDCKGPSLSICFSLHIDRHFLKSVVMFHGRLLSYSIFLSLINPLLLSKGWICKR